MGEEQSSADGRQRLAGYRWLSFDVVGTLIDFEQGILECLREIAHAEGVDLDDQHALACFASAEDEQQRLAPELPFTQMLAPIYHRMAGELHLPDTEEHGAALRESIPRWPAFPDAAEALARLAERYRLVALTNADNWALRRMAATLGDPFDDSVTAEDVGVNKPDPRVFEACADRQRVHGYRREDWLHVAQSQYHDIATATRLGVATCWIERRAGKDGFGATPRPQSITVPDYHYASLEQLCTAVERADPRRVPRRSPTRHAVGPRLRGMTEWQVTRWRELPSMIAARTGDEVVKSQLAPRFQEAIDEAAMRLGDTGADDYLAGWERSPWTEAEGTPAEVLDRVATELEAEWPPDRIARYLDELRP